MSQLPPPNFGNFPSSFNMNGFPAWPVAQVQGTSPSIFGRPQAPLLGFPPGLPVNSFPCSPVSQFRPILWPNMNPLPYHVVSQATRQKTPSQQHRPHATNFQRKTDTCKAEQNGQNSSLKKEFNCDACQKEFTSKETMNAHLGSHVQCNYEGCTFKASRKMLKLHWIQVHASGKMRIKLETPEEIAKWREERKRKYPTLANVEKKKVEEAKRRASGQILQTKNFRYRRGQRGGRTFQQGGHNHFNNRHQGKRSQEDANDKGATENHSQQSKTMQGNEISEDPNRLQSGGDPLSLFVLADSEDSNSDTETETKEKLLAPSKSPNTEEEAGVSNEVSAGASALSSLCSAYASDSEDNEEMSEISNNKQTDLAHDEKDAKMSEFREDKDSILEVKSKVKQQTNGRSRRFQKRKRKPNNKVNSKSVGIRKSTLLEKLLAPEIRHERNVILQCLRHIVKNNFFGVEDTGLPSPNVFNKLNNVANLDFDSYI